MDESFSTVLDKKHFESLVENAQFPELRILNYSHVSITEVPRELREWRVYFPGSKLEVMDISHSLVKDVGYIPAYASSNGVATTLVVQFARITKVSVQLLEDWSSVPDFYVDVRNNPVHCDCDLKDLLSQLPNDTRWAGPAMTYYRRQLSVLACATPPELSGRVIDSLGVDDLQCPVVMAHGADLWPAMAALVAVVLALMVLLVLAVKYRKEVSESVCDIH